MRREARRREQQYDVVVVGGGLSGVCAAMAAARWGARTALVQGRGMLGGNASSEIRMHICGAACQGGKADALETGIIEELLLENKRLNDAQNFTVFDAILYQQVKKTPNLTVYLDTVMHAAETSGSRISSVLCYQHTTEITWELSGEIFVDCTGNSTLGYLAGADFRVGSEARSEFDEPHAPEEPNGYSMGSTLLFKAVDTGRPVRFVRPEWARVFTEEQLRHRPHCNPASLSEEGRAAHGLTSTANYSGNPNREAGARGSAAKGIDYGFWWIELGGDADDIILEQGRIRDELIRSVYGVWDHIKNGGDHGAANYQLSWVGIQPGTRDSRRLVGDYLLNENDVLGNRLFPDAVAYGGWPVDNHTPGGINDADKPPSMMVRFDGLYTIPYRCFYSANVENLMMAGRNISATKLGMSSARVMGTCAVGGQAAGTAAAMCVERGADPRGIGSDITALQQRLLRDDCHIPGLRNEDELDRARAARVSASSFAPGGEPAQVINGVARRVGAAANCWESDGVGEAGETLSLQLARRESLREVRLTFDPNLTRIIAPTLSEVRLSQQQPGVPAELVRDYRLRLYDGGRCAWETFVSGNHQRLNVHSFAPVACDRIELAVTATNGHPSVRVFEVRAY